MKKTKFLSVLLTVIFLFSLVSVSAMAGDSSSGCGLGWQVFKDNSLVSSSSRAITNVTFLNTGAMTFGTSGCAKHSIVKNEAKAIHYAQANQNQLMVDLVKE